MICKSNHRNVEGIDIPLGVKIYQTYILMKYSSISSRTPSYTVVDKTDYSSANLRYYQNIMEAPDVGKYLPAKVNI